MRSAADHSTRAGWGTLLLTLALAACGGAAPGELVVVHNAEVTLNGEIAAAGDPIPLGAMLATNSTGVAEFQLEGASLTCQMFPDAAVEILEEGDPALRYVVGATVCWIASGQQVNVLAQDRLLSVSRGVFRVSVTDADLAIQMVEGEGTVQESPSSLDAPPTSSPKQKASQIAAGQQLSRSNANDPSGVQDAIEPIQLADIPENQQHVANEFGQVLLEQESEANESESTPPPTTTTESQTVGGAGGG